MSEIRPFVAKFDSSNYVDALAAGDACIAIGWSGDVLQARDLAAEAGTGVRIAYAIPKEGAMMWFDQLAIPKDAPNPDGAYRFIDFMLRHEVIAAASNYVHYANGNKASQALLDPDLFGDPAIYPPDDVMARLYVASTADLPAMKLMTRLWTRIKTGQ
jgi:putrescine transport system substrate-binding protein